MSDDDKEIDYKELCRCHQSTIDYLRGQLDVYKEIVNTLLPSQPNSRLADKIMGID